MLRSRAIALNIAATSRLIGVGNLSAGHLSRTKLSMSAPFSTNAAEVFENESPAKNVMERVPKKDMQSAVLKENSIQENEATHQQVQQLSEQMEDTLNKEKQFVEDNKISGASAQQIWQSNRVDTSKSLTTSEDVLKDLSEKNRDTSMMGSITETIVQMGNEVKDAAKESLEDAKETLKKSINPTSNTVTENQGSSSSRRQGNKKASESNDADKPRSKQYSENKQNASIL
jgi:hypothetical protein